jgi:hypothetical protein
MLARIDLGRRFPAMEALVNNPRLSANARLAMRKAASGDIAQPVDYVARRRRILCLIVVTS